MALAYCVGLIQAVVLLGHGLVSIPRRLIRDADYGKKLRRLQSRAPKVHEKLEDSKSELKELDDMVEELRKRKNGVSRDHQDWIEELSMATPRTVSTVGALPLHGTGRTVPAVITDRYLADVDRRISRTRHKVLRFQDTWRTLVQEAVETQTILNSYASKQLTFRNQGERRSFIRRAPILVPTLRYLLYCKVIPAVRITSGALLAMASICVVWSEMVKFLAPRLSVISFTVVHHGKVSFAGQLIAAFWILYMCASVLASFGDVKVWGNRALVHRNTYPESACWYAGQVAKMTVPLTYNFLTFMPPDVHKATTFYDFLGRLIVLTPLGKGFDYFFPMFILVPACATLFNFYGRIKSLFGYRLLDDEEENDADASYGSGSWREGRDLIAQEMQGRANLDPESLLGTDSLRGSTIGGSLSTTSRRAVDGTPTMYIPPASNASRARSERLSAATRAAEEEDESIFSGFAHRFQNTLDSIDRPEWLSDLGKRPKWMGGVEGNSEASGRAEPGGRLGRWFGGRPADGRVRL